MSLILYYVVFILTEKIKKWKKSIKNCINLMIKNLK